MGGGIEVKKHNWMFMGNDYSDGKGDWFYCDLCDSWKRTYDEKVFKMLPDMYTRMIKEGRITGI